MDQFLAGAFDTGKAVLREYINATIGFERLAAEIMRQLERDRETYGQSSPERIGGAGVLISLRQKG